MTNPFGINISPFILKNSNELLNSLDSNKVVWIVKERNSGKTTSVRSILEKNKKKYFYFNCSYFISFDSFLKKLIKSYLTKYVVSNDLGKITETLSLMKDYFEEIKVELKIDNDHTKINIVSVNFSSAEKALKEFVPMMYSIADKENIILILDEFDQLFILEGKKEKELSSFVGLLSNKNPIIFIGSDRDLMQGYMTSEISQRLKPKFYQMEEIPETHWRIHLENIFKNSLGKNIPQKAMNFIIEISQGNVHYLNIIAQKIYEVEKNNEDYNFDRIKEELFNSNEHFYKEILSGLSLNQKRAIVLIAETKGINVYKSENLKKVGLSKSSMERCLTSFLSQKIIIKKGTDVQIKDPLFEEWLISKFV